MTTAYYTLYLRAVRNERNRIEGALTNAVQVELARLWRHFRADLVRMSGKAGNSPAMHAVISQEIWQDYQHAVTKRLQAEILKGAASLAAVHGDWIGRILGAPIRIVTSEQATASMSELGTMITNSTITLQRVAAQRIVGWYNTPGSTVRDLVTSLQPEFGVVRAQLIGQTETTRLNSATQLLTAKQLDITEWWWQTRRNEGVCTRKLVGPDGAFYAGCRGLHGKHFLIGQPMPPGHPGCYCDAPLVLPVRKAVYPGVDLSKAYDPNEKRDATGEWTAGGGGNASAKPKAAPVLTIHPSKVAPKGHTIIGSLPNGARTRSGDIPLKDNALLHQHGFRWMGSSEFKKLIDGKHRYGGPNTDEIQAGNWWAPMPGDFFYGGAKDSYLVEVGVPIGTGYGLDAAPGSVGLEHVVGAWKYSEKDGKGNLENVIRQEDVQKADFQEDEHPRAGDGEFTTKGGGGQAQPQAKAPKAKGSKPYDAAPEELGTIYHGDKHEKVPKVDPERLQARDYGFYGNGFYVSRQKDYAQSYGHVISEYKFAPDTKILRSALTAKEADPGLVKDVIERETSLIQARHPGELSDNSKAYLDDIKTSPPSWARAVYSYGKAAGYDVVMHSDGEIVVINPDKLVYQEGKKIKVRPSVRKADFIETEHPRDPTGEFTDKGGGVGAKGKEVKVERVKARILSKPEEIVNMQADNFEHRWGWDAAHTREQYVKNKKEFYEKNEAPKEFIDKVADGVDEAVSGGQAESIPVIVRKVDPDYNETFVAGLYENGTITILYDQREPKMQTNKIGEKPADIGMTYANPIAGLYTHEYGHHYCGYLHPEIERRARAIDLGSKEMREWVKKNISYYATYNDRELAAECYALSKHKDFASLPEETKKFVTDLLEIK